MEQNDLKIREVEKAIAKVQGYLGADEGRLLYNLAKNCKGKGVIVEIGSWRGKSTIWLANGSKNGAGAKVYAIDPHIGSPEHQKEFGKVETFEDFKKNIEQAGISDFVVPLVKTSEEAAKQWSGEPIELLWIDGAHEYDMVKLDFDSWEPYLVEGGTIAFHDTGLRGSKDREGPKQFVEKYIFNSKHFRDIRFLETITFATKVNKNTVKERVKNRYTLYLKQIYQQLRWVFMNVPKPSFLKTLVNKVVKN